VTARLQNPLSLEVGLALGAEPVPVGTLAWRDRRAFFQFAPSFVALGIQLSPLRMPLGPQLFEANPVLLEGLHGLFDDSLPDGWGRLLLDRALRQTGIEPSAMTPLARLAHVGQRGMGALIYRPDYGDSADLGAIDLDSLADSVRRVLEGDAERVVRQLLDLNGSSGGARPKVLVGVRGDDLIHGVDDLPPGYEHWLIKFVNTEDPVDVGAIEAAYADMARASGIEMTDTRLFPAKHGPGYFGTRRFDRVAGARVHVHTFCGLLNADPRRTSTGYATLLKATRALTHDQREVEKVFDRMVFNVMAHNRDDHTKNHAFLLNDGVWRATPAYDLTFSPGPGNEHYLDVAGNGRNPGEAEILDVAKSTDISPKRALDAIERVAAAVSAWPRFAANHGVSRGSIERIGAILAQHVVEGRRRRDG
jgi:serine/threonine-protein kinase HipA